MKLKDFVLIPVFLFVVLVYFGLNGLALPQTIDTGLCINVALFAIALLIFVFTTSAFFRLSRLEKELDKAASEFKVMFKDKGVYLWDFVKSDRTLFGKGAAKRQFGEYREEMLRLEALSNEEFSCDIGSYFNEELVDYEAKKNIYDIVPGVMTGLGILGTFIGLSIGLQSFHTDTSEEIMQSIVPLIDGLKVAFHTSVYGMIFSLCYNYLYKKRLESAYRSVNEFLDAFRKYVNPDNANDSAGRLLACQTEQVRYQKAMMAALGQFQSQMTDMRREFSSMMDQFMHLSTDYQKDGVTQMANAFLERMNTSLSDRFKELGDAIRQDCEAQKNNSEYLRRVMSEIQIMVNQVHLANTDAAKTAECLAKYISAIQTAVYSVNDSYTKVAGQLEASVDIQKKQETMISSLAVMEEKVLDSAEEFFRQNEEQNKRFLSIKKAMDESVKQLLAAMQEELETWNGELLKTNQEYVRQMTKETEEYAQFLKQQKKGWPMLKKRSEE